MWSSGTNWVVFPGTFQGASIRGNPQSTPHHPPSHSDPTGDTATRDWLNQINQFYSAATATALQEFATQPDIDGNMLIDNTVVVYVTEVARAWDHNQQNMPVIVFGGKNTRVRGGTFLKVDGRIAGRADRRHWQPPVQRHVAGADADLRRQQQRPVRRERCTDADRRSPGIFT